MMTVRELMNALEDKRGDWDDPVVVINPVVARGEMRYEIVGIEYDAGPADERDTGGGHMRLIVSRRA
jgi:hypothetical protein